jgi:hypothetical protein
MFVATTLEWLSPAAEVAVERVVSCHDGLFFHTKAYQKDLLTLIILRIIGLVSGIIELIPDSP